MKRNLQLIALWALLLAGLAVLLSACNLHTPNLYKVSTVKEGRHDFDLGTSPIGRKVEVTALIPQGYYLPSVDSFDWNKGVGIMTNVHPHKTSALLGWRVINGVVELSPYIHAADKSTTYLSSKDAVKVDIGEWFTYSVEDRGEEWVFTIEGRAFVYEKEKTDGINFRSGWWFGGTSPAPQDLEVWWY